MSKSKFKISINTGDTFTDTIRQDEHGSFFYQKVLSNGSLRGKIIKFLDSKTLQITENWRLKKDVIKGYSFQILQQEHPITKITEYDIENQILSLHQSLPSSILKKEGLNFSITAHEEAPLLAARLMTQTCIDQKLPSVAIKLGSTKGTNALLEKRGTRTAFFVTKGFRDLLQIGTQQRPDIFALNIQKSKPLPDEIIEINERISAKGEVLMPLTLPDDALLNSLKSAGIDSVAIALLNAYKNPQYEQILSKHLQEKGFKYISVSTELSALMKFLPRAQTSVVDAYLAPILHHYLQNISESVESLQVMSSAGSLVSVASFRAKDSLLSGPAGGVMGAGNIAEASGYSQIIGFDMGGTSTDVARYASKPDYHYDLQVGDAHVFSPAIHIETVAAGGGSFCYFDGFQLCVGPESAGAFPGPACYGAGGGLTITDINLLLGRLDDTQFGIPIDKEASLKKLDELLQKMYQATSKKSNSTEILTGFLQIANERMASAIQKISLYRGYNPSEYALVGFGGAGGLHACQVAQKLNIQTVLIPKEAGLLSAYGISQAKLERFAEKQILRHLTEEDDSFLEKAFKEISQKAKNQLMDDGLEASQIEIREELLLLRLTGQESTLEIQKANYQTMKMDFKQQYEKIYGYYPEKRKIEIASIQVWVREKSSIEIKNIQQSISHYNPTPHHYQDAFVDEAW
jgi:5-oxoprolinase (ATP-hydrolysing)